MYPAIFLILLLLIPSNLETAIIRGESQNTEEFLVTQETSSFFHPRKTTRKNEQSSERFQEQATADETEKSMGAPETSTANSGLDIRHLLNILVQLQNQSNLIREESKFLISSYLNEMKVVLEASKEVDSYLSSKIELVSKILSDYSESKPAIMSTKEEELTTESLVTPSNHLVQPENSDVNGGTDAVKALHLYLLSKIEESIRIRPAEFNHRTIVKAHVAINQIIELNEAEGYIKVNVILNVDYRNKFFKWDPRDFNNITGTVIDAKDKMWMPDIFSYNGVDLRNDRNYVQTSPIIMASGWVLYSQPRILKFTCSFDNYYFPFDHQICVLTFRSWVHDKNEIYIEAIDLDFDYSKDNEEWEILKVIQSTGFMRHEDFYVSEFYENNYSVYEKHILLKRRPLYYIVNLLIPAICVSQISFFGFFTSTSSEGDRTEKINLGMGTLLAMSVLLLTVSGMTTISSRHVPMIGTFFLVNMVLICLGIIMTSVIMAIHQRGQRREEVPKWVLSILFFRIAPKIGLRVPSIITKSRGRKYVKKPSHCESKPIRGEEFLLQELPQLKVLSDRLDSVITARQKELPEVEYIFLAKVLDLLMLVIFSLVLYVSVGCIIFIGLSQAPPEFNTRKAIHENPYFEEGYPKRYVDEMIMVHDSDSNGVVDYQEANISRSNCKMQGCVDMMRSYIEYADFNDDRNTTKDELTTLLEKFSLPEVNSAVTGAFGTADKNSDQRLSEGEFDTFINMAREHFKESDRNSDKLFSVLDQNDDGFLNMIEICFGY